MRELMRCTMRLGRCCCLGIACIKVSGLRVVCAVSMMKSRLLLGLWVRLMVMVVVCGESWTVKEKAERLLCTVVAVPGASPSLAKAADCAW